MGDATTGNGNDNSDGGSFWEALAAARKANEDKAAEQQRNSRELAEAVAETDRLAYLLSHGTPTEPLTDTHGRLILATNEFIARTLLALARAVARFPGFDYLEKECYMPHDGLGHKAAGHLWTRAVQQITEGELIREVAMAREALKTEPSVGWWGMSDDTEYGMVQVFRRFDGLGTRGLNAFHYKVIMAGYRSAQPPTATTPAPAPEVISPVAAPEAVTGHDPKGPRKADVADAVLARLLKEHGEAIADLTLDRLTELLQRSGVDCKRGTVATTAFWRKVRPQLCREVAHRVIRDRAGRSGPHGTERSDE